MQLEIRDTPGKGKGLFSKTFVPANTTILRFDGIPIARKDISDFSGPVAACLLQIGSDLYLDIKNHSSFFINHDCHPNCGIKLSVNKAFLQTIRPIEAGTELTFDYSTTSSEDIDTWTMKCNCSLFGCRKLITGFKSLPEKTKERYKQQGIVAYYLL